MSGWLIFGLGLLALWAIEKIVDGWVKRARRSECHCQCNRSPDSVRGCNHDGTDS